jgi:hypothetical protein
MSENEIQTVVDNFIATAVVNGLTNLSVQPRDQERTRLVPGKGIWLKNGTDIPCRVVAQDDLGNWCVVTEDGQVRQYLADEVA